MNLKQLDCKIFTNIGTPRSMQCFSLDESSSDLGLLTLASGDDTTYCLMKFKDCYIHTYGGLGEDSIQDHRYYGAGINSLSGYQVEDSDWINQRYGKRGTERTQNLKHYLFFFEDNCFECIARKVEFIYDIDEIRKIIDQSHQEMLQELDGIGL